MDGAISINVRPGHKPKDLPAIDVEDVEADVYYRDKDGVIHLNEVKNTPKSFVKKLGKIRKKKKKNPGHGGQFKRYLEWMKEGAKRGQTRKAIVYIEKSEPDFFRMIDKEVIRDLKNSITKEDTISTIVQVENIKFSDDCY